MVHFSKDQIDRQGRRTTESGGQVSIKVLYTKVTFCNGTILGYCNGSRMVRFTG